MDFTLDERKTQEISLLDSLDLGSWLKLPLDIMRDVGPGVQTLGGLLRVTDKETFRAVSEIALNARLPVSTVRKHLLALDAGGWIENKGRGHTRRNRPRRTATLSVTKKTRDALDSKLHLDEDGNQKLVYGVLAWWACCQIRKVGKLPWSAKAVLAVLMARLMSLKAAAEREGNHIGDEELEGAFENMGGEERFRFSLTDLMDDTGLTHDSVTKAKWLLQHLGIVQWHGTPRRKGSRFEPGVTPETDRLVPNWGFRVIVKPAGPGKCRLDFGQAKG